MKDDRRGRERRREVLSNHLSPWGWGGRGGKHPPRLLDHSREVQEASGEKKAGRTHSDLSTPTLNQKSLKSKILSSAAPFHVA